MRRCVPRQDVWEHRAFRFCGRRNLKGQRSFPWHITAGGVDGDCEHGTCTRVRCRRAAPRCKPPVGPCTSTPGAPFDRQFACRATLGRAEADPGGFLLLSVRDGVQSAIGVFELPRAASGHYPALKRAAMAMFTLPGFDSGFIIQEATLGRSSTRTTPSTRSSMPA